MFYTKKQLEEEIGKRMFELNRERDTRDKFDRLERRIYELEERVMRLEGNPSTANAIRETNCAPAQKTC